MDIVRTPLAESVIGAAIDVHRALGPGLLELPYQLAMQHELRLRELQFETQVPVPLLYKGVTLNCQYRLDLVVERQLVVEIKAVAALLPVHSAQVLSYLRLSKLRQGLLFNFHESQLVRGLKSFLLSDAA